MPSYSPFLSASGYFQFFIYSSFALTTEETLTLEFSQEPRTALTVLPSSVCSSHLPLSHSCPVDFLLLKILHFPFHLISNLPFDFSTGITLSGNISRTFLTSQVKFSIEYPLRILNLSFITLTRNEGLYLGCIFYFIFLFGFLHQTICLNSSVAQVC